MEFQAYAEIESLFRQPDLLKAEEVVITEKIDGTNSRIGVINSQFMVGGRNAVYDLNAPKNDFGFVQWCKENNVENRLRSLAIDNVIVYGEFCGEKINVPIYRKGRNFLVIDIKINGSYQDWNKVVELASKMGFSTVPILYRGKPSIEIFEQYRKGASVYALERSGKKQTQEGIVIKATKATYTKRGYLIAKHKDNLFEERKSLQEGKDPIITTGYAYANEFVTRERLKHVIQQLKEAGKYEDDLGCVGEMIERMTKDIIEKEGKEEYEKLTDKQKNSAKKLIKKLTREEFQNYLIEKMINEGTN